MRIDLENHKLLDFVYCCTLRKDLDEVPVEALAIEGLQESLGISYTALNHRMQKTYLDWFQARLTKLQNDPTERAWAKWYAERRAGKPLGEPEADVDVPQETPYKVINWKYGIAILLALIGVECYMYTGGIIDVLLWLNIDLTCLESLDYVFDLLNYINICYIFNSLVLFIIAMYWSSPRPTNLSKFKAKLDKTKNWWWRIAILYVLFNILLYIMSVGGDSVDVLMAPHDDPGCPDLVYDTFYGISVYGGVLGVFMSLWFFTWAMYWDSPRPITLSEFKTKLHQSSWFWWIFWLIGPAIFGLGLVLTFILWLFATQEWIWMVLAIPIIYIAVFNLVFGTIYGEEL